MQKDTDLFQAPHVLSGLNVAITGLCVPLRVSTSQDHKSTMVRLSHAIPDILSVILRSLSLRERFNCALVCKAWAEAATAATHSIILRNSVQDLSGLQHWLEKHGGQLEVLQLHECDVAALTALPCCAKLQDLLLHGSVFYDMPSRTWGDIASATKLTSISLKFVQTASQQADVVAALTALPNLEQLTWHFVSCSGKRELFDSSLLQQVTRLTSLDLNCITTAALQHLGSLTKLQHLSISDQNGFNSNAAPGHWAAAGFPVLQNLKALTSLELASWYVADLPASVSQLTALRQLDVPAATPAALNGLQVLTGLTQLCVWDMADLSYQSPPLKLPGLQHLKLSDDDFATMPMSYLASCTQLQYLDLQGFNLKGPGSLVASTMLQHLELSRCFMLAADGAADPVSWQQVFPGPGQLPHLTQLQLWPEEPAVQQADINHLVECCSKLQVLGLEALKDSSALALVRLPGLTHLHLDRASNEHCGTIQDVVHLTGLRQLALWITGWVSAAGLRQLAVLSQLTGLGFGKFYSRQLDTLAHHLMKDRLPDSGYLYAIINKAPSGSPPDVSTRLLDICDVVDACEGLGVEAVVAAAKKELKLSGPAEDGRPKPLTAEALLAAAAALKARGD